MSETERDAAILESLARFTHLGVMRARSYAMAIAMTAAARSAARSGGLTLLATTGGTWQPPEMILPVLDEVSPVIIPGGIRQDLLADVTAGLISANQARIMTARNPVTAGVTGQPASASPGGEAVLPASRLVNQADQGAVAAGKKETAAKGGSGLPPEVAERKIRDAARTRRARLTPEERIREVLAEPLGLDQAELDEKVPYGQAAPGMCTDCLTARAKPGDTRCWYCAKAAGYRAGRIGSCGCGCPSREEHLARERRAELAAQQEKHGTRNACPRPSRRQHRVLTGTRLGAAGQLATLAAALVFGLMTLYGVTSALVPACIFLLLSVIFTGRDRQRRKPPGTNTGKGSPGGRAW